MNDTVAAQPHAEMAPCVLFYFLFFYPFISPQFRGIQLVVTVLSHRCNSRTDSGEAKVESHASSETQPNQAALLLTTTHIQPGSQPHQCVRGNTIHLATRSACTAPSPPQESLVRLPAKPSLASMTLGQLCNAPWASRSRQSLGSNPESLVAQP